MAMKNWVFAAAVVFILGASMIFRSDHAAAQGTQPSAPAAKPTPPPSGDDEVIRVETEAVNVLFTAQDRNHRLLTNLKPEDVRILENGQPQQISAFMRQIDLPLSLAI